MTRRPTSAAPAAEAPVVAETAFAVLLQALPGVAQTGDVVEGAPERIAELIASGGGRAATPADREQAWPRHFKLA